MTIEIREASTRDVPLILRFIRELASYEKLEHEVVATEKGLEKHLFGENRSAEVIIAEREDSAVGFALFFENFSTFLGRPGLYLEDLYVSPEQRGHGVGQALLIHLAKIAKARDYGRFEWSVLDWNEPALGFYKSLGAKAMNGWILHRVSGDALARLAATEPGTE